MGEWERRGQGWRARGWGKGREKGEDGDEGRGWEMREGKG